jgi:KipI family sensor histidine kinase inhibitor
VTQTVGHAGAILAPLGDSALTIRLGDRVDPVLAARARELASGIRAARLPMLREVVVGYATVTIWYDAPAADYDTVAAAIAQIIASPPGVAIESSQRAPREHVMPVVYDGPDLEEVARRTGLDASDVILRHSDRWYDVYLIGFVPGWGYLGALDPMLVLPRRAEPRTRVPAGSVAIAGAQTGVYPLVTPGGWHLIGRTSVVLFDPTADRPALLAPGDRVRFTVADRS